MRLYVVGEAWSHNYTQTSQFFDKHDTDRADKIMVKLEDSESALVKSHAKDMRARVTARELTINPKGKQPVTYRNYTRHFFSANQANPVGLNDDSDRERRFLISACDPRHKGDFEFFARVRAALFNEAAGYEVGAWLMQIDLTGWNVRQLPSNPYMDQLFQEERSIEQQFVEDVWKAGKSYDPTSLYHAYTDFCIEEGINDFPVKSSIEFGRRMMSLGFIRDQVIKKEVRGGRRVVYTKLKPASVEKPGAEGEGLEEDEVSTGAGAGAGGGSPVHAAMSSIKFRPAPGGFSAVSQFQR